MMSWMLFWVVLAGGRIGESENAKVSSTTYQLLLLLLKEYQDMTCQYQSLYPDY